MKIQRNTNINSWLWTRSHLKKRNKRNLKRKRIRLEKQRLKLRDRDLVQTKVTKRVENVRISASNSLSLLQSPEDVIDLIQRIDHNKKGKYSRKTIEVDLTGISDIDIGAISMLLAKVNEISKMQHLRIWGKGPINKKCYDIFQNSGFLDYMTDLSGQKFKKQSDNFMVKVGADKTRNEKVGKTIEKSMKFLLGFDQMYPPVYSIVQEICSNSVEWANSNNEDKNWFLGVNFREENGRKFVHYTMTDIGAGILNTLKRKFGKILSDLFAGTSDTKILYQAFQRKYGSKTGEPNRNRGLPLIKDRYEKKFIKSLHVITNDVWLNFDQGSHSKNLSRHFSGTFYFWEVDIKCIEQWKKLMTN